MAIFRKRSKASQPQPLTITLRYEFRELKKAALVAIERNGEEFSNEDIPFESDSFMGFQLLLCKTKQARGEKKINTYTMLDPQRLTSPLYHAARRESGWLKLILGTNSHPYFSSRKKILLGFPAQAKPLLIPEIEIEEYFNKKLTRHAATEDEISAIISSIEDEEKIRTIDISIDVQSPSLEDEWKITGDQPNEHNLHFGCEVKIHITHDKSKQPFVCWISNKDIFELSPFKDSRLFNVSKPKRNKIGNQQVITIGGEPPIPIKKKSGIEACLAVISEDNIDISILRDKILTFFLANPITSLEWDENPTKRYFNGKVPIEFMDNRFGNPDKKRRHWSSRLLHEVLPETSTAVILTIPNRKKN